MRCRRGYARYMLLPLLVCAMFVVIARDMRDGRRRGGNVTRQYVNVRAGGFMSMRECGERAAIERRGAEALYKCRYARHMLEVVRRQRGRCVIAERRCYVNVAVAMIAATMSMRRCAICRYAAPLTPPSRHAILPTPAFTLAGDAATRHVFHA